MTRELTRAAGRRFQEASMTDSVTAGSYVETVDPNTLATVRTIINIHYTGPALVKFHSPIVSELEAVGQQFAVAHLTLKVPISAPRIPSGDMVIVVASTTDPLLVNREFRVKAAPQSGNVTSHRYPIEELS